MVGRNLGLLQCLLYVHTVRTVLYTKCISADTLGDFVWRPSTHKKMSFTKLHPTNNGAMHTVGMCAYRSCTFGTYAQLALVNYRRLAHSSLFQSRVGNLSRVIFGWAGLVSILQGLSLPPSLPCRLIIQLKVGQISQENTAVDKRGPIFGCCRAR